MKASPEASWTLSWRKVHLVGSAEQKKSYFPYWSGKLGFVAIFDHVRMLNRFDRMRDIRVSVDTESFNESSVVLGSVP
jgi:hypothetical protein